jgi:hypothetical protein
MLGELTESSTLSEFGACLEYNKSYVKMLLSLKFRSLTKFILKDFHIFQMITDQSINKVNYFFSFLYKSILFQSQRIRLFYDPNSLSSFNKYRIIHTYFDLTVAQDDNS